MTAERTLSTLVMSLRTTVLLSLCIVVAGCDRSSPTAPQMEPESANVVFTDPLALAAHEETITRLLEDTIRQAGGSLDVGFITVTVAADPARTIPGWGVGGYTLSPTDIEIVVDPNVPNLDMILRERLPHITAHELHHAVRWRGPGPYATLLEALVTEGLADHFAIELLGTPIPPWSRAFPESQTEFYLDRARPELDSLFDFQAWFFGFGTDLPQWTGYTLGYRLVRDYLDGNPGSSAASLVNTPADAFRP